MRVGSVVFATDQGLGVLAKQFYDAEVITDVVILNHSSRPSHREWYPGAPMVSIQDLPVAGRQLIDSVGAMLFFETPFDWKLIAHCRAKGVKACLMPMYECMPKQLVYNPDQFICPSLLDLQYYPNGHKDARTGEVYKSLYVPVPVPDTIRWRQRSRAYTFVHNTGNGGLKGRNGTKELIDAWKLIRSPARLIVRAQKGVLDGVDVPANVELRVGTFDYESLFSEGDVFIFPERFNGLSLPLQEAYASGMLVMATRRFPMTTWLPLAPLIPPDGYIQSCVSPRCLEFKEAVITPERIAEWVDDWYGKDITEYSRSGREWAKTMAWPVIKPRYDEVLRS